LLLLPGRYTPGRHIPGFKPQLYTREVYTRVYPRVYNRVSLSCTRVYIGFSPHVPGCITGVSLLWYRVYNRGIPPMVPGWYITGCTSCYPGGIYQGVPPATRVCTMVGMYSLLCWVYHGGVCTPYYASLGIPRCYTAGPRCCIYRPWDPGVQ